MVRTIVGLIYILGALSVAIITFRNRNNMPCSVQGLNEKNYIVVDRLNFNKIMVIQNILACALVFLSGVLCIITDRASAVGLPGFIFFINLICSKPAKKFIIMK